MITNRVRLCIPKWTSSLHPLTPQWIYPKGVRGWIAHFCVRLLYGFGAYTAIAQDEMEMVDVSNEDLVRGLQRWNVSIDRLLHGPCRYLLVGRKQQQELMGCAVNEPFIFGGPPISVSDGKHLSVLGLKIVCVPWMDGAIPLPDIEALEQ